MAEIFTSAFRTRLKSLAIIILIFYLLTMAVWLEQNNYPWVAVGKLVQTASASTEELIENHKGEWGATIPQLLVFNVPAHQIGAWTLKNGTAEMLRIRYGDELEGVDIEVIGSGIQTQDRIEHVEQACDAGAVVWVFDPEDETFFEYEKNE
jgi:hypothetical protein